MAKFNATTAAEGTRAEREIILPNATTADGKPVKVIVRPITPLEREDVLQRARAAAKKAGVDPVKGEDTYELARALETCLIAILDIDCPACAKVRHAKGAALDAGEAVCACGSTIRAPFFASADEVRKHGSDLLVVFLAQHQEVWQSECSPFDTEVSDDDVVAACRAEVATSGPGFCLSLPHATLWRLWRSMAFRLLSSLEDKSPSGAPAQAAPPTTTSEGAALQ